MPWNPDDPFYIPGLVSPEDWDWRYEGKWIAKYFYKDPAKLKDWKMLDFWKYLGLLRELDRLDKLQHPPIKEGEI